MARFGQSLYQPRHDTLGFNPFNPFHVSLKKGAEAALIVGVTAATGGAATPAALAAAGVLASGKKQSSSAATSAPGNSSDPSNVLANFSNSELAVGSVAGLALLVAFIR